MEHGDYATPSVGRFMYMGYFNLLLYEELAEDIVSASLVRVRIKTLNLAYTKESD
jgi:hypothetical protein